MQRFVIFFVAVGILGLAYSFAQTEEPTQKNVRELQQKRIQLMEKRTKLAESLVEVGLGDRNDAIRASMDALEVRLEYANSDKEKRQLLTRLIAENDQLIEFAEIAVDAPVRPARPGQSSATGHVQVAAELLFLRAERVRFEIALAELPAR
ncbi:MAG: hypothetical protein AAGG48_23885 [Planctomycetota bacterium]